MGSYFLAREELSFREFIPQRYYGILKVVCRDVQRTRIVLSIYFSPLQVAVVVTLSVVDVYIDRLVRVLDMPFMEVMSTLSDGDVLVRRIKAWRLVQGC